MHVCFPRPLDSLLHVRGRQPWLLLAGAACTGAVALAGCGTREPDIDLGPPEAPRGAVAGVTSVPSPLAGGAARPTATPAVEQEAVPPAERETPHELLPDLQVMPTRELYVEDGGSGRKLRFSTTVVNTGDGPLDIAGMFDAARGITTATQLVHRSDGSTKEHLAGEFIFHPGHEHWHFEDFTVLELWTYGDGGELDEMRATTGKATFCAVDEVLEYADLPHVPDGPAYLQCGQSVQGISVGWSDTYTADLIGQELDITGVPDGRYAVRTIVDPAERLRETRNDNNALAVYVELRGDSVSMLDGP